MKGGSGALIAEFPSAGEALAALLALRAEGFRELELYAPYEVPEAAEVLQFARPRSLLRAALLLGLLGAASGYGVQWYCDSYAYPLAIGGRPLHPAPAFVPISFELGILLAAFGVFFALLVACGLPRLWQPIFEVDGFERATLDRYFVRIEASDPQFDPESTPERIEELAPLRVQFLEAA